MRHSTIANAVGILLASNRFLTRAQSPTVHNSNLNVTYTGVLYEGIETFYAIPYGQDTSPPNRFKNPIAYVPQAGSSFEATSKGPACPQQHGAPFTPLYLSNVTLTSEDCLHLNVYRSAGTAANASLPVMIYVHGGSFIVGSKDELVIQPGGLIKQSVKMEQPVVVVNINYRLGVFGFAQSKALSAEGNTNMGLRDQRMAIEWVRDNIAAFGGDPSSIEILGQSSGGLAMGMQMLAYGGSQGFSFQRVSAESQIMEGGITGNFTLHAMERIVQPVGCNTSDLQSAATLSCLRNLSTNALLGAQIATNLSTPAANVGDEWLPFVDGDFLPAAPSELIAEGRFANVTTMVGWCENDGTFFVGTPTTEQDTYDFFKAYLPGMTTANVEELLSLYPSSDFSANPSANLSAQLYRAGRILRDILFTCQPINFGNALQRAGQDVYYWTQNETMLEEVLVSLGTPGYGVIHTSNFAFEFHNLSHYNVDDFLYHPNGTDFALANRQSHSWAAFANHGAPSLAGQGTLDGWKPAYSTSGEIDIYIIGGPNEGLSAWNGSGATNEALVAQKLPERCGFLNRPDIIVQLGY
ncbi:putative lipase [Neohortaea acidophila]|uniref:Carboxylic ester hydrolase n=1 Tax=Neohortaea acidophila TaxID=245834 RepID=A0A6A6PRT6_9PEZI|nr:putative lipase [Neohortaea acidophila]KAF2482391.1 putative lipase [Neohortaea acidophila]